MLSRSRILLVEDDPGQAVTISRLLISEGYAVDIEADGETGLAKALERTCALVILNAILPKKTGFHVCCDLRQAGVDTAILMLTARPLPIDRVTGLKMGADDCLAIPFDPSELLARVEALLRRVEKENRIPVRTFQFSDVEMDFELGKVQKAGRPVNMAAKELQLISYLVQNRDRVVSLKRFCKKCGNTRATSRPEPLTCTYPGYARNWTIPTIPATSRQFAEKATVLRPELTPAARRPGHGPRRG